jgi:hypothetical protein
MPLSHNESRMQVRDTYGTHVLRPLPGTSQCLTLAFSRADGCPWWARLL